MNTTSTGVEDVVRTSRVRKLTDALRTIWFMLSSLPMMYTIFNKSKPWTRSWAEPEQPGPQLAVPTSQTYPVVVNHRIHSGFSFIVPPKTAQNVHGIGFALTFYNTSEHELSIDMNTSARAIVSEPDPIEPLFDETGKGEEDDD